MDPPEYLRSLLASARGHGLAFDDVWGQAVIRAARISQAPAQWLQALGEVRDAWERAFENLPSTPAEQALTAVGDGLHADFDHDLEARRCAYCDRWIPTDRDPRARFCDDSHRRLYNYALERKRAAADRPRAGTDDSHLARP